MNKENLLQNMDHKESCSPATTSETGKQEDQTHGSDSLQEQNSHYRDNPQIRYGGSTESKFSGNKFNGLESNGTGSHSHESSGSSSGSFRRPSRSMSNSNQLDWNYKELMMMIKEVKRYLPAEQQQISSKPSTVRALNYALQCVQRVQGGSFFHAVSDHGVYQTDEAMYSIEELAAVTSEYALKNTDTFVAVFSLLSGWMVHLSEQAASVLNFKKKVLESTRFAELLAPRDVSVFYAHTNKSHLPLWNVETQAASLYDYTQVKSFFCRIRGGNNQYQRKHYYPFRITPYLVSVCRSDHREAESCCLALAEKIHSGYEALQIPMEERIFTTTHSPDCVFLEIDDRAVPLLGYLPQDLIGTSILMYLHPEDRPLMVAIHQKVLKFAGQLPFEHSPIRFCTQNGDYIILDTSWSSFVSPWSRKVVFIVGRHKVRTSPLNEDVFAARSREMNSVGEEIKELQGQIYKLLLQPVHSNGSSGYGSLGSNGSYEHYISIASSSDSSGKCVEEIQREPMTLQQVCADVSQIKNLGQQLYIESRSKPQNEKDMDLDAELQGALRNNTTRDPAAASYNDSRNTHPISSYQQINCVDNIIRYLESCSIPALKRKCESSTNTSSSSLEDDRQARQGQNKAQVLEEVTALEDATLQFEQIEQFPANARSPTMLPEEFKQVGLTKEVLSAHTQKQEKNYVDRLRQRILLSPYRSYLQQGNRNNKVYFHGQGGPPSGQTRPASYKRGKLGKLKCLKLLNSSDSSSCNRNGSSLPRETRTTSLKPSSSLPEASHLGLSSMALPLPMVLPTQPYPVAGFPIPSMTSLEGVCVPPSVGLEFLAPSHLPYSTQPFPAPNIGTVMAMDFHNSPVCTQIPQPLFPSLYPCSSASYPYPTVPPGPASAMPSVAPDPVGHILPTSMPLPAEEQQEAPGNQSPIFGNSRSSSPLQLNLLQEELPKTLEPPNEAEIQTHMEIKCGNDPEDSGNNDNHSVDSEMLDLLLHEDSRSGTSSAVSGSGSAESVSLGPSSSSNGTSGCGTGSVNSRGYFASSDSSEASKRGRRNQEMEEKGIFSCEPRIESLWRIASHTPQHVLMMTYQIPERIQAEVLKEDLEKLAVMQKKQPWFTEQQKEELAKVHPWICNQTIPQEINIQGCVTCGSRVGDCQIAVTENRDPYMENRVSTLETLPSLAQD
uniref:Period circadian regulator 3 n=1 Tax=Sphenodon punctatus TaxID=8508 RepID=A0A8D0H7B3_SPHPU